MSIKKCNRCRTDITAKDKEYVFKTVLSSISLCSSCTKHLLEEGQNMIPDFVGYKRIFRSEIDKFLNKNVKVFAYVKSKKYWEQYLIGESLKLLNPKRSGEENTTTLSTKAFPIECNIFYYVTTKQDAYKDEYEPKKSKFVQLTLF